MSAYRRNRGFTLVELLVVIGIIALLISILLPSLNRARQAASLVSCQSQFKQVYNGVMFYAHENKGYLPYQSRNDATSAEYGNGTFAMIEMVLTRYLGNSNVDHINGKLSPVFICTEGLQGGEGTGFVWAPGAIRTIGWNPRAFPGRGQQAWNDAEYPQRKLASIRDGASKIAFWDANQILDWNMCPEPQRDNLDGWRYSWGHMWADPPVNSYDAGHMDQPVDSGPNVDVPGWWAGAQIRYRHMRNTVTPVAFFDGHVESRKYDNAKKVGEIKAREICISRH